MRFGPIAAIFTGIVAGALLTILAELLLVYSIVRSGALPANADAQPPSLERWIAQTSLRAAIQREAPRDDNPVQPTGANLSAGMKSYVANCAVCHGVADGNATNVAAGLYQRPPQFGAHGVEDDPAGVTYWKIYHGVRFTGMPSYAATLTDNEIWQVTAFLSNMDRLPASVHAQWKKARAPETIAPTALQMHGRR
jgi:mono/diheme cytochrome c family protein